MTVYAAGCSTASFRSTPSFATGLSPYRLAAGDFNQDGKADLAVIDSGNNNVSILLANNANGFSSPQNINAGSGPRGIAVGDVNADGKLDIVTSDFSGGAVVVLGNGTGGFGAANTFPAGTNPAHVAIGDFNNDGKLDLAVANSSGGNVSILLGNGQGSFGAPANFPVGANPRHVIVADFNNDSKADLAVVNTNTMNVSVLLGTGTGSFGAATNFNVGASPLSASAGDFNADGKTDLAVANSTSDNVSILLGNGSGGFGTATTVLTGTSPTSIAVSDFTGDGKIDLAVSVAQINSVAILVGNGTGGFAAGKYFGVGDQPQSIAMADVNGDGKLDLATADFGTGTVSLLRGLGVGNFDGTLNVTSNRDNRAITIGDFNNDGNSDFAVASISSQNITVYLGNGSADFGPATTFTAMNDAANVMAADLNDDGNTDLVGIGHTFGAIVLLGNGLGNFNQIGSFSAGSFSTESVAGDFNHDGRVDLAIANNSAGAVLVLRGDGAGNFGAPTSFTTGVGAVGVSSGDFNEDGHTDLVVTNTSDSVSILLANGSGGFLPARNITAGTRPFSVAVADFNSDDNADLVVANQTSNTISILLGDGAGNFSLPTNYAAGDTTNSVVVADFNGDGKSDVAAANVNTFGTLSSVSVFTNDGTGAFGLAMNIAVGRGADDLAAADFNNDGKTDLAVTNRTTRTTSILINTCSEAPQPAPQLSIGDLTVREGSQATFNVTLSAPADQIVSVGYYTANGSATAGSDYQAAVGRLVFPVGVTSKTITVPVFVDTLNEGSESFKVLLADALNAVVNDGKSEATVLDEPVLSFSSSNISVAENVGQVDVTVTRAGNLAAACTVKYGTQNITATDRSDFTAAFGTLHFNAGETTKTITLFITDDRFAESSESFAVQLTDPFNATLGSISSTSIAIADNDASTGPSPVRWDTNFDSDFFVRQHYRDFLNREADQAGLSFWKNQIDECEARPEPERQGCREVRRINVSAAFFLSIEFQETGYLVYRTYGAAFGKTRIGSKVPLTLVEFLSDGQQIGQGVVVNTPGWEQALEANKVAYFDDFVQRPQFLSLYPQSMPAATFVDALNINTGNSLSQAERDGLVADLNSGAKTRAQVVRAVAENSNFSTSGRSRAFVLMQYFGYLRRNPNDAPDSDFSGYDFWLTKLNDHGGNFVSAEMVKSFLVSTEYFGRFGQ